MKRTRAEANAKLVDDVVWTGLPTTGGEAAHLDTFLRLDAVKKATGLGRSTIYDLMAEDRFPRPVKPGGQNAKAVAWLASEISAWQRQKVAERDASRVQTVIDSNDNAPEIGQVAVRIVTDNKAGARQPAVHGARCDNEFGTGAVQEALASGSTTTETLRPLSFVKASTMAGQPIPVRDWQVEGLIPATNVTLLGGDGGTGKSLIALKDAWAAVSLNAERNSR
jgi:prophage regulatory protein